MVGWSRCQVTDVVARRERRLHKVLRQQFAATLRWSLICPLWCSRPGCAATCVIAWPTWKAGTSKPTWPSWIVLWWGPAISQPPRQKSCSISTATSSSEWHCSALKLRTKTKATGRVLLGEQNWSALGSVLRGGGRAWVVFSPSGSTRFQIFGFVSTSWGLILQKGVPHSCSNGIWSFWWIWQIWLIILAILMNMVKLVILANMVNLVSLVNLVNLICHCQVRFKIYRSWFHSNCCAIFLIRKILTGLPFS